MVLITLPTLFASSETSNNIITNCSDVFIDILTQNSNLITFNKRDSRYVLSNKIITSWPCWHQYPTSAPSVVKICDPCVYVIQKFKTDRICHKQLRLIRISYFSIGLFYAFYFFHRYKPEAPSTETGNVLFICVTSC